MRASGFTARPKVSDSSASLARASVWRERARHSGSVPRMTLSRTRQVVGQGEMLVHHADAARQRGLGLSGRQRLAERLDAALVGHVVAEQDVHERGLAGAVLAQQRQHLAAMQIEADRIVGDERAEALGDAASRRTTSVARYRCPFPCGGRVASSAELAGGRGVGADGGIVEAIFRHDCATPIPPSPARGRGTGCILSSTSARRR